MPSSEWNTKNRIVFPVYLISACDFKAITGFDPPPTPVNSAAYTKHNFEFKEEYAEPGMIEDIILDRGEEVEGGKENRRPPGEENAYELPAFDEDFLDRELSQQQAKHLSFRNFV